VCCTVNVKVSTSGNSSDAVTIAVVDDTGSEIASHEGVTNEGFSFSVDSPKLWSPSEPTLYNLTVKFGDDEVASYT
jgi:beta-galactosidase/beta-glucuronidase